MVNLKGRGGAEKIVSFSGTVYGEPRGEGGLGNFQIGK